jgi:hypothetical protein
MLHGVVKGGPQEVRRVLVVPEALPKAVADKLHSLHVQTLTYSWKGSKPQIPPLGTLL